ncbi:hypothetical protein [Desulfosarcina sp.]|uniref:hypothetical protein n=1 Tax=Desulfosarcina sp. TaxID=2027861 RepID=UPI003561A5F7
MVRSQTCPLCGEKARYTNSSHAQEIKCYFCKHCFNFIISQPAEAIITQYPKQQRLAFSIKSKKAFVCQVLVINTTDTDGQESIDFKYEPESKWF